MLASLVALLRRSRSATSHTKDSLAPTGFEMFLLGFLSLCIGTILYVTTVFVLHQNLWNAVQAADSVKRLIAADPYRQSVNQDEATRAIVLVLGQGTSGTSDDLTRRAGSIKLLGHCLIGNPDFPNGLAPPLCLAAEAAGRLNDGSQNSFVDQHKPYLTAVMAGLPGAYEDYANFSRLTDASSQAEEERTLRDRWTGGPTWFKTGFTFKTAPIPPIDELTAVINRFRVDGGISSTSVDPTIFELQTTLLGLHRSEPEVRWASSLLASARGYEQWALICIFIFSLGWLGIRQRYLRSAIETSPILGKAPDPGVDLWLKVRTGQKSPADRRIDQIENAFALLHERWDESRWVQRWAAKALPAIGFIGTVRGILLALPDAEGIVRATSPLAQASAISTVAGSLGLAFSTTMYALLFGLILSVIDDAQQAAEFNLLCNTRDEVLSKKDSNA